MDKKNEILKATYHLFCEKGYNLSMSEIAEAVKIKTPSLYSHFKSKDEIIELTIKSEIEQCFDIICKKTSQLQNKSCEEKLKYMLFYAIDYYKKSHRIQFWEHMSLVENKKIRKKNITLIQERDKYLFEHITNCFIKGVENNEIKSTINEGTIYLYFSMLQGILNPTLFYQDNLIKLEDFASKIWEAYWDSIKV